MNRNTQGTARIINLQKNYLSTPHGTNNISYKKINHKNTITAMIIQ